MNEDNTEAQTKDQISAALDTVKLLAEHNRDLLNTLKKRAKYNSIFGWTWRTGVTFSPLIAYHFDVIKLTISL